SYKATNQQHSPQKTLVTHEGVKPGVTSVTSSASRAERPGGRGGDWPLRVFDLRADVEARKPAALRAGSGPSARGCQPHGDPAGAATHRTLAHEQSDRRLIRQAMREAQPGGRREIRKRASRRARQIERDHAESAGPYDQIERPNRARDRFAD